VKLVESGRVVSGRVLDLCCGAGTNPVYLAKKEFDVTTLDISEKAVEYAKEKARKAKVDINSLVASYLNLPFKSEEFDFAFDFGCFHHVQENARTTFIEGVYKVLKPKSPFFLVCFSYENGLAWNHFRREQIEELFGDFFEITWIKHVSSLEGDGITRYFFEVMMKKNYTYASASSKELK
jgi:cyclopropane fatty-acyl-phospholipid synthase-like methyltransferase